MAASIRQFLSIAGIAAATLSGAADSVPAGTVADVEERTRPFGELCLEGDACGGVEAVPVVVVATGRSGSDVYSAHCRTCHETGLNDAPKLGDAEAWAPRLAKGMDELVRVTREGLNLMPPMGTCMTCSDAEFRAAIEHMTGTAEEP